MLNGAETRWEYSDNNLPCALRIKCLNNRSWTRETVLSCFKEHPGHFLMQTTISKSNGKDMLDCFINIYVHTELVEWLYHVNSGTACKCIAADMLMSYLVLWSAYWQWSNNCISIQQPIQITHASTRKIWFLRVHAWTHVFLHFAHVSYLSCGWFVL